MAIFSITTKQSQSIVPSPRKKNFGTIKFSLRKFKRSFGTNTFLIRLPWRLSPSLLITSQHAPCVQVLAVHRSKCSGSARLHCDHSCFRQFAPVVRRTQRVQGLHCLRACGLRCNGYSCLISYRAQLHATAQNALAYNRKRKGAHCGAPDCVLSLTSRVMCVASLQSIHQKLFAALRTSWLLPLRRLRRFQSVTLRASRGRIQQS